MALELLSTTANSVHVEYSISTEKKRREEKRREEKRREEKRTSEEKMVEE